MRGESAAAYRYCQIGKYAVCLDQSIFVALRTLGLGHTEYRLESLGISRARAWRAIAIFLRRKIGLAKTNHYLSLPVFGHLAMQVHRGYKVFDFSRSEVTKVFDQSVSIHDAETEVEACKTASAVSAAPQFLLSDAQTSWFREEYICGTHATELVSLRSSDYRTFYPDIEKCLIELAHCQAPVKVDVSVHVDRLADEIYRNRWLEAGTSLEDVDRITTYMGKLRTWLTENATSDPLQLILTHGDFSLVNAISADDGLRFIDWEGIGTGGLFSDLFNFMFAEQYYGRASSRFTAEVEFFYQKFRDAILIRCPELIDAASLPPVFARRLYYLERLRLLLDRDVSTNLLDVICKSISMFKDFDDDVGDSRL